MKAPRWDDALHRWFAKQLVAAVHTRCGKLAAVYADGDGWRWERKCRCDPPPALPAGAELARHLAKAEAIINALPPGREYSHHAPLKIYI